MTGAEMNDGRCSCWYGLCAIHSGHCCFRDTYRCHSIPEEQRTEANRLNWEARPEEKAS